MFDLNAKNLPAQSDEKYEEFLEQMNNDSIHFSVTLNNQCFSFCQANAKKAHLKYTTFLNNNPDFLNGLNKYTLKTIVKSYAQSRQKNFATPLTLLNANDLIEYLPRHDVKYFIRYGEIYLHGGDDDFRKAVIQFFTDNPKTRQDFIKLYTEEKPVIEIEPFLKKYGFDLAMHEGKLTLYDCNANEIASYGDVDEFKTALEDDLLAFLYNLKNENVFELPLFSCTIPGLPPTVNHYFARSLSRVFKKPEAQQWQNDVCNTFRILWEGKPAFGGRIKEEITFFVKNKKRWDIDNRVKILQDCLAMSEIIKDDSQIDTLKVRRIESDCEETVIILRSM